MAQTTDIDTLAAWRAEGEKASSLDIDRHDGLGAAMAAATPGLSEQELTERLGPPNVDDGTAWVYVVGPQPLMTPVLDLLIVRFDAAGRVSGAEPDTSEGYTPP